MKKILALVLALTMLMGMSVNVFAEEPKCEFNKTEDAGTGMLVNGDHKLDGWYAPTPEGHYKKCINANTTETCPYYEEDSLEVHTFSNWTASDCGTSCYRECSICGFRLFYEHKGTSCSLCGWGTAPVKVEKYEEPATPAAEIRAAEEEALAVNVVTTNKEQLASENASVIPGAAYNMSAFTTTKGFVAGLNKVVKANAKETSVAIYTKKPFAFSKSLVKAINDGKKDVVYYFTHAGHVYSVTIPAGTDASTILEKNGFAGPLYVGKVLGTTTLVK